MREIKFQLIWKHEGKVVKEIVSLDYLLENNPKAPRFTKGKLRVAAELIAKRQYTGLKDKNGVEIYEGDIVEIYGDHPGTDVGTTGEVKFYECQYWVDDGYGAISFWQEDCSLEVVGNIHQNPDLLNE